MKIRPVSDLRNKYPEIEEVLRDSGEVYLTKNGYGAAVLMDLSRYMELTGKAPATHRKVIKKSPEGRGFLHEYADSRLALQEKNAGRIHAMEKFRKEGDSNAE